MSLITGGIATMVPCVTNANPSQSLLGGGGGGGGSNAPNQSFSTITLNPNGFVYLPNTATLAANGQIIGYEEFANVSTTSLSVNFPSGYANKNGTTGVWSVLNEQSSANYYGDFAAGRFAVLGNNSGTSVSVPVIDADTNGKMSINAVSTINISTPTLLLNGAPIGGSAGPNPQVSTLSFSAFSQGTAGFMNMDGFFAICDNGATPTGNNYLIGIQTQTNPNTTGNNYSFLSSFVSTLSLTLLNSGYDVSPASATLITGASSDGRAIIANPVPLSTLTLLANPVNIPYNLQVSSINGALPASNITNQYTANSVSSIGGLPIYNSQVARVGKLQTVQFNFVYASTISGSNAGFIDMIASAMAPGNWLWQAPPSVVLNGIKTGSAGIPIGVNAQLTGDPGDLSQELTLSFQFADSNIAQNVLCTMTGIAYN